MRVTTFGTRGGLPVSAPDKSLYGGNTTCLQIESELLGTEMAVCIDAGTGFLPFSKKILANAAKHLVVLQTHYHYDHIQGLIIAPPIYADDLRMDVFGPVEKQIGPREAYALLMSPPLHPVPLQKIEAHISFHRVENPTTSAIFIHPRLGAQLIRNEDLVAARSGKGLLSLNGMSVPLDEGLSVQMHYTDHPERTIAYRIEEGFRGKAFAFLTDEEVRVEPPRSLQQFLSGVQLLIQDAQFNDETYNARAAGWGHGTPSYAVELAIGAGVKRVGLTHHDPSATDTDVDAVYREALKTRRDRPIEIFPCKDYDCIEV